MNTAQAAYMTAAALLETLRAEYNSRMPAAPTADDLDDPAWDAFDDACEKLHAELGIFAAEAAATEAGDLLLDWVLKHIESDPSSDIRRQVPEFRGNLASCRRHYKGRRKMIEISMRIKTAA